MNYDYSASRQDRLRKSNKTLIICVILLFSIISFAGGYFLASWENYGQTTKASVKKEIVDKSEKKDIPEEVDFGLFWKVWDNVTDKYIEQPVDEEAMFYGALTGIIASLQDPYSVFLDPELTKSFNEEIDGTFDGIGAEIGVRDNRIVIIAPLPGTPADKAGLKAGDVILAIDQMDSTNMNLDYAVKLIRGEKGTPVALLIQREDEEPEEVTVIRDVIKVDSVKWEIKEEDGDKIGYILITSFNSDTANKFNEAVREIILQQPKGLILDLRNNAGGLLDQSIEVASGFVPQGVVVYEEFQDGSKREYTALGNAQLEGVKTVVLINEGSASASEIVAGALQDYQAAALVGKTTFGKGSVQDLEEFSDGSSLKLTVAKWLTPNGRSIDEKGIEPDEEVELTKEDYENNRDPQLDRALEIVVSE